MLNLLLTSKRDNRSREEFIMIGNAICLFTMVNLLFTSKCDNRSAEECKMVGSAICLFALKNIKVNCRSSHIFASFIFVLFLFLQQVQKSNDLNILYCA